MNLAILQGKLSSSPRPVDLPSGDQLLALEVTIRPAEGPADTVPVTWAAAPASAAGWEPGLEVLVVGRVRRRFFRAGTSTGSRTEVVAATVLPATRRAAVRTAVARAIDAIREGL